jgi:hypothetical protein
MTMDAVEMAVSDKQYWLLMAVFGENLTVCGDAHHTCPSHRRRA